MDPIVVTIVACAETQVREFSVELRHKALSSATRHAQYGSHTLRRRNTLELLHFMGEGTYYVCAFGTRRLLFTTSIAAATAHGLLPAGSQPSAVRKRVSATALLQRTMTIRPRQLSTLFNVGDAALAWVMFTGEQGPAINAIAPVNAPALPFAPNDAHVHALAVDISRALATYCTGMVAIGDGQ